MRSGVRKVLPLPFFLGGDEPSHQLANMGVHIFFVERLLSSLPC